MGQVTAPLVGRASELGVLVDAVAAADAGDPRVVLVAGPAGIGKTRLVRALRDHVGDSGTFLLGGAVSIGGDDLPFAPLTSALRRSGAPWPPADVPAGDTARLRILESLLDELGQLAADGVVVLTVEDLHWADPSTRSAIDFLARNLTDERLALIGTYRDDELHRQHPWRAVEAELLRLDPVQRLVVPPLDEDACARLAAHHLGTDAGLEVLEAIWERGQGNPFFTEELARAALEGEQGVPARLDTILDRQVEQLPPKVRRVLQAAAILGRVDDPAVLERVAGLDADVVVDALRAGVDTGFLTAHDDGLVFRHALLGEAVEQALLPTERRSLHRAAAEELVASTGGDAAVSNDGSIGDGSVGDAAVSNDGSAVDDGHLDAIARHWHLAGERGEAHRTARRAAAVAVARHDHLAALAALDIAVDTVDPDAPPEELAALLVAAGRTALDAGAIDRAVGIAERAVELLRSTDDVDARLRAAALLADAVSTTLDRPRALQIAVAAADELDAASPATRAHLLALLTGLLALNYLYDEAERWGREAVEAARSVGQADDEAFATLYLAVAVEVAGRHDEGQALFARADALALGAGRPGIAFLARSNLVQVLHYLGRHRQALEIALGGIDDARRLGLGRTFAPALLGFGVLQAQQLGELDVARRLLADAPRRVASYPGVLLDLAVARQAVLEGRPGDAHQPLRRVRTAARHTMALVAPMWAAVRLEAALLEDDPVPGVLDAAAVVEQANPLILAAGGGCVLSRLAVLDAARPLVDPAAIAAVERMRADATAAIGAVVDDGRATPAVVAWQALVEALTSGCDDGDRLVAQLDAADLGGEVPWARYAELAAAVRAGERARAAEVAEALRASSPLEPVATLTADLARRARLWSTDPIGEASGLTEREVEVLGLVAEGLTNREIAERLFISPKTASVHVTNVMRKLEVGDRRAAAAVGRRLGLVAGA